MAEQKTYTFWGSNPEKGDRFDKAEDWIAAVFETEEEANAFASSEGKGYEFTGISNYDIKSGIRVASGFHSARIFCENMSENKAKKELQNLNTRCSAYFKKPVNGGSYVKFDKDGFVEGEGYEFYSNADNGIQESRKSLKHLLLFEQFIGEAKKLKPIKISVKKSRKNPYTFSDKMDNDELLKLHNLANYMWTADEEELDGYKDTDYKKAQKEIFDLMMSRGANPYRQKYTWADDWKEGDES